MALPGSLTSTRTGFRDPLCTQRIGKMTTVAAGAPPTIVVMGIAVEGGEEKVKLVKRVR